MCQFSAGVIVTDTDNAEGRGSLVEDAFFGEKSRAIWSIYINGAVLAIVMPEILWYVHSLHTVGARY